MFFYVMKDKNATPTYSKICVWRSERINNTNIIDGVNAVDKEQTALPVELYFMSIDSIIFLEGKS